MQSQKVKLRYLPLAWAAVLLTNLTVAVLNILGINISELCHLFHLSVPWTLALPIYDAYQLLIVALLLTLLKRDGVDLKDIGFKGTPIKYYFVALAPLVIIQYLWNFSAMISSKLGLTMLWWGNSNIIAPIKTPQDVLILSVFPTFLCSPLEEILYRGYLLKALMERLNVGLTLILDSIIFASIHYAYGPGVMIFIFFWTFIPSLLYLKTESVYPSILFHSANNLIAYLIIPLMFH